MQRIDRWERCVHSEYTYINMKLGSLEIVVHEAVKFVTTQNILNEQGTVTAMNENNRERRWNYYYHYNDDRRWAFLRAGSINNNEQNKVKIVDGFILSFPA